MHVCPMVTPGTPPIPHVGGPIIMGSPNVVTGGPFAARVTDTCVCVGPPDVIAVGSLSVIINNLCAARVADQTVHGGAIIIGLPTVIIGDNGNPMAAMVLAVNPLGGTQNCADIASSAIFRLYGTNPNATAPLSGATQTNVFLTRHGLNMTYGHTLDDAYAAARAGGPGTTLAVTMYWAGGGGHVFTMTNYYGTPVIIEGQNWSATQPPQAITDPAVARARYPASNFGIATLPSLTSNR
jgi:uncharacterized Zn-binding protein involved in type VI secretion